MTAATDPTHILRRNFSEMMSSQAAPADPCQIPQIQNAFSVATGVDKYGSTPVSEMGKTMQQTLASATGPKEQAIDMAHINLYRQGLREMEGIKAEPKGGSVFSDFLGAGAKLAKDTLDEFRQKPEQNLTMNTPAPRAPGLFA